MNGTISSVPWFTKFHGATNFKKMQDLLDYGDYEDEDMLETVDTEPDEVTKTLLQFAENATSDIKKYLGRRKDEDSCDIFKDKWKTGMSGKALYYADLLKAAQGNDSSDDTKKQSRVKLDNRHKYTGKINKKLGLGPLEELFQFILPKKIKLEDKKVKRLNQTHKVPLHDRKLPSSFWREPLLNSCCNSKLQTETQRGSINCDTSKEPELNFSNLTVVSNASPITPDFNDLLDSWNRDENMEISAGNPAFTSHSTYCSTAISAK